MSTYLEAMLLLLPPDAGGRSAPVAPREGSYRPFVAAGDVVTRARLIEGPPRLAPGDEARVMLEVESDAIPAYDGSELHVLEHGQQLVGIVTVLRVCRSTNIV
ncbi:MAG TPA: hypothetical protein VEK11_09170 [Thermoanaerobaculia bacterium]|nr:hypothetical protein [Thermoanaerobaculia bacterium]